MNIFEEFHKIVTVMDENNLEYALVGGVAMAFHDEARFTEDIDILLLPGDMDILIKVLSEIGYSESATPWTFKETNMTLHRFIKIVGNDHLLLDILTANENRTQQIIINSLRAESIYGTVRVAAKEDLIWMKRQRDSDQDRVDIKRLEDNRNEKNRQNP